MTGTQGTARIVTRRTVVAGVGAAGLSAALVACGGSDDSSKPAGSSDKSAGSSDKSASSGNGGGAGAGAAPLAKTSDIPEGGGKIFADRKVVVTQPKPNEFKCFSAVCTHRGCTVGSISDGVIQCPCHGSRFSIEDGSVKAGPATQPLAAEQITVKSGSISLA